MAESSSVGVTSVDCSVAEPLAVVGVVVGGGSKSERPVEPPKGPGGGVPCDSCVAVCNAASEDTRMGRGVGVGSGRGVAEGGDLGDVEGG